VSERDKEIGWMNGSGTYKVANAHSKRFDVTVSRLDEIAPTLKVTMIDRHMETQYRLEMHRQEAKVLMTALNNFFKDEVPLDPQT